MLFGSHFVLPQKAAAESNITCFVMQKLKDQKKKKKKKKISFALPCPALRTTTSIDREERGPPLDSLKCGTPGFDPRFFP